MFLKNKYKQSKQDVIDDIKSSGVDTCILKINLKATSKIKDHFIYEVTYLDDGELKTVPIVSTSILGVIDVCRHMLTKDYQNKKLVFSQDPRM